MNLSTLEPTFLERFERVWTALRRYRILMGLCAAGLAAGIALAILASADYWWELSWTARAVGLDVAAVLIVGVSWRALVVPLRRWTPPRTAVELEERFPQLGQRIRTVVQYAGHGEKRIESEGVAPSLVEALAEETRIRAQPIPIHELVPWRRVPLAAAIAALPALLLIAAAVIDPQWRLAVERALLSRRAYTTLVVAPGDATVEQGESLPINVELKGRANRQVVLLTRPEDRATAPWTSTPLEPSGPGSAASRTHKLEKIKKSFLYRVVAGSASSRSYRVGVRYPLVIKTFDVALQPPAYTGLEPSSVKGGNLDVIQGTSATFRVGFENPPAAAAIVVTETSQDSRGKKTTSTRVFPSRLDGSELTAALVLTKDLTYRVEASSTDDRHLPETNYWINVLEDHPPRVVFDEPDEALEVHPIAEVVHRVRVGDDFGLSKAGIVFRTDDGEEKTLILKDFAPRNGKPRKTAILEATLALETLGLTPARSVTYYAFAEDNYPTGPRRTESDLRYIDIRPFKREYKMTDMSAGAGDNETLTSLAELIARQRFNLNRTVRLAKHRPTDLTAPEDPLKIAGFEEMLAGLTREFAEGVEGIIGERIDALHLAEGAMLAAVDSLDRLRNSEAATREAEALSRLIEARRTLLIRIGSDAQGAMARAFRSYDRMQAQKIRKPKTKEEEAEAIAEELEQLADDEDFVYATIAALAEPGDPKSAEAKGQAGAESKEAKEDEPPPGDRPPAKEQGGSKTKAAGDGASGTNGKAEAGTDRGQGNPPGAGQEPKAAGNDQPGEEDRSKTSKKPDEGTGPNGEDADQKPPEAPKPPSRREIMERQEKVADQARAIEERLKKLEAASELARTRMARSAAKAEEASGHLVRGNSKEAARAAKSAGATLHELARQVKGELARESAEELAMARDLAEEIADREEQFAVPAQAKSSPGTASGRRGKPGMPSGADDLERIAEAVRTLEGWLKDLDRRGEGKAAVAIRELIEEGKVAEVVKGTERIGALYEGGQQAEARREASENAKRLAVLSRTLDEMHREVVAPRLAELVEYDRRVAELIAELAKVTTRAEVEQWHRRAVTLLRELEAKEGMTREVADLTEAMRVAGWREVGGVWRVTGNLGTHWAVPLAYNDSLRLIATRIQQRIQDLVLKDMQAARDEATPPEFKELVERYYEVLSRNGAGR